MQAWLCENPIGVEALRWTELPHYWLLQYRLGAA